MCKVRMYVVALYIDSYVYLRNFCDISFAVMGGRFENI